MRRAKEERKIIENVESDEESNAEYGKEGKMIDWLDDETTRAFSVQLFFFENTTQQQQRPYVHLTLDYSLLLECAADAGGNCDKVHFY